MAISVSGWRTQQAADGDRLVSDRRARLERIRSLVRMMDEAFVIPGTGYRVGWDSLIGLLPVAGDTISAAISLYIIREAAELGAPRRLLARMGWNVAVDFVGGAIPVAGDLFDAAWKANRKNLRLLERWMEKESRAGRL